MTLERDLSIVKKSDNLPIANISPHYQRQLRQWSGAPCDGNSGRVGSATQGYYGRESGSALITFSTPLKEASSYVQYQNSHTVHPFLLPGKQYIICVHHGIHGGKGAEIYHPSTGAQRVGKPRETVLG